MSTSGAFTGIPLSVHDAEMPYVFDENLKMTLLHKLHQCACSRILVHGST